MANPISGEGAWARAEQLARRIHQLVTVPMRSENHPIWTRHGDVHGLKAIGSGNEKAMEEALVDWQLRSNLCQQLPGLPLRSSRSHRRVAPRTRDSRCQ